MELKNKKENNYTSRIKEIKSKFTELTHVTELNYLLSDSCVECLQFHYLKFHNY